MACVRRVCWEFDNDTRVDEGEELNQKFDVFEVDGEPFFRLDPWSKSLAECVGDCDAVMKNKQYRKNLGRSTALRVIAQLRNDAGDEHAKELKGINAGNPATNVALLKCARHVPRVKIQAARAESVKLDVLLPSVADGEPFPTKVLKQVHPSDRVAMAFTAEGLSHVIAMVRELGASSEPLHKRAENLPKGVWKMSEEAGSKRRRNAQQPPEEEQPPVASAPSPAKRLMVCVNGKFVAVGSAGDGLSKLEETKQILGGS